MGSSTNGFDGQYIIDQTQDDRSYFIPGHITKHRIQWRDKQLLHKLWDLFGIVIDEQLQKVLKDGIDELFQIFAASAGDLRDGISQLPIDIPASDMNAIR